MIFAAQDTPRIFGVPPGVDFPQALFDNLNRLTNDQPPDVLARVNILVPTRRMQRRLQKLYEDGPARLLPRIGVITDVTHLDPGAILPPAMSTLRRTLELKEVVAKLVEMDTSLSQTSTIDLAQSLINLLNEIEGENVPLTALDDIAGTSASGHWQQSLQFLKAIRGYIETLKESGAGPEARHRVAVEALSARWNAAPTHDPIIIAGSTGSRDTTRRLMAAVARLPQGALVLPGFDFELPRGIWEALADNRAAEDHPQFRFAKLMTELELNPEGVVRWGDGDNKRNRLISLSLRPASFTDAWRSEGPMIGDLVQATAGLALLEAVQPRDEALAIAVALRQAVAAGKRAALISPDATLARRVSAALARWNIRPDDSSGTPLHLSPAGRFLRQTGQLIGQTPDPASLVALLKHPLTYHANRGPFQLFVQELELFLRKKAAPQVGEVELKAFDSTKSGDAKEFTAWLKKRLELLSGPLPADLNDAVELHIAVAEAFCGDSTLWSGSDGEAVEKVITNFAREGSFEGRVDFSEYLQMFDSALSAESDREPHGARSDVTIWGTLEARVQGADLVVLGGLNEGVWPEQPTPDPWLNRQMREQIGLLLPERQIGLAAHDFQQAAGAPSVTLSRAKRSEDSDTVPSRWLNRLTNLLGGLETGPDALDAMKRRGEVFIAAANSLDSPETSIPLAHRPAPAPPPNARPTTYSVTEIEKLIRDPYAIYAKHILRLRPLDPLTPTPDARLKGIVFHDILEDFFAVDADFADRDAAFQRLLNVAFTHMDAKVPWPATRLHWWGQLNANFEKLFDDEVQRRTDTEQIAREVKGSYRVPGTPFTINGKADRIDRGADGLVIYDYKTGPAPKAKVIQYYDRQLLIEAVMAESGAFENIPPETVAKVMHLGMGRTPKDQKTELEGVNETVTVASDLAKLLTRFAQANTGYIARRAREAQPFEGDYDHLSRFGEWDESSQTTPEAME